MIFPECIFARQYAKEDNKEIESQDYKPKARYRERCTAA
jgi:hypothetical protein